MTTLPTVEDDPCGRAKILSAAIDDLVLGATAVEVEREAANGLRRRVKFTAANLPEMKKLANEAKSACSVLNGRGPIRRHRPIMIGTV